MTLWDRWKERLAELKRLGHPSFNVTPDSHKGLSEAQRKAALDPVQEIRDFISKNYTPNNETRKEQIARDWSTRLSALEEKMLYAEAAAMICRRGTETLLSARKQEDWADSWEKFRLFIFRMATGIGLAALVLITYWLANRWGIPMPLRMPSLP